MKHDNSKTIKLSNEHILRVENLSKKYNMNDSEIFRLGVDLINHFESQGELLRIIQKLLESDTRE